VVEMALKDIAKRALRSRLGPNPQCIAGATMGLIAATQPWLYREGWWWPDLVSAGRLFRPVFGVTEFNLFEILTFDTLDVGSFLLIFLVGTILSFFSPAGAVPQIVGLLGFAFGYSSVGLPASDVFGSWSLGFGYVLGIASTIIVMQSPAKAVFAANGGKPVRMLGRFAALSPRTISSWR
jgi:xanthosine utilization system XapX-like protein